jgi:hypothetical protein
VVRLTLRPLPRRVRGRCASARRDPGHHLAFDAGLRARGQLFLEPPEDVRVAALEPRHAPALPCLLHQHRVDAGLARAVAEAALAHVDPLRIRRQRPQARVVDQRVVQHHVGGLECTRTAQRDQVGRPGPGADEDDAAGHRQAASLTSSAPLVRLLEGSTTISAPPTRLAS